MSERVSSYFTDNILQILTCYAGKALSRNGAQLMQIVIEMTWIMLESTDERDPYKVSVVAI